MKKLAELIAREAGLVATHYDTGMEANDLEFDLDGVQIFVHGVKVDVGDDEFYFERDGVIKEIMEEENYREIEVRHELDGLQDAYETVTTSENAMRIYLDVETNEIWADIYKSLSSWSEYDDEDIIEVAAYEDASGGEDRFNISLSEFLNDIKLGVEENQRKREELEGIKNIKEEW